MLLLCGKKATSAVHRISSAAPTRNRPPWLRTSSLNVRTSSSQVLSHDERRPGHSIAYSKPDVSLQQQHGELTIHKDLDLVRLRGSQYLTTETLSKHPCQLIDSALLGRLPYEADHDHTTGGMSNLLHLGYQQIFFRPMLNRKQMLPDGTDTRFLPGKGSIWKYRLWAGGSVAYNVTSPLSVAYTSRSYQLETIKDIRVLGKESPEKVFVTVKRTIASEAQAKGYMNREARIQHLLKLEKPVMEEEYTLCFLRNAPGNLADKAGIAPPDNALFSYTMTPDSNLLAQFSALTYNAHKIHFSPEYAQNEYGMKNIVVHGPFTQILLADFMRRSLSRYRTANEGVVLFPKSINYTNLRPLYADEPMTLCCKPLKLPANQEPWQADTWRVWIETGQGEQRAMAVKAEVGIGIATTDMIKPKAKDTARTSKVS